MAGMACPFCLPRLNDGVAVREAGNEVKVPDIGESLVQVIEVA